MTYTHKAAWRGIASDHTAALLLAAYHIGAPLARCIDSGGVCINQSPARGRILIRVLAPGWNATS
jgi:hypothetical protein